MRLDFLIEPRVEAVSVRQARQRVVVRQKMNMLLGFLPVAQIADSDGVMRLTGEIDRAKDEFSRNELAVDVAQFSLDPLARSRHQLEPDGLLGQADRQRFPDHVVGNIARQFCQARIDRNNLVAVADQQTLGRRIGEAAHAIDFQFGAMAFADIERKTRASKQQDRQRRKRDAERKPAGRKRHFRNHDRRVGNDRNRAHGGEMMTTDRQREQHRADSLPFHRPVAQTGWQRGCSDRRPQHDGNDNENGVPLNPSGDLESCHSGVVHRRDAAADGRSTDPAPRRHLFPDAIKRPTPVSRIAATSDSMVRMMLYPLGMPGEYASMAMKCVAQMPKPLAVAATHNQTSRM